MPGHMSFLNTSNTPQNIPTQSLKKKRIVRIGLFFVVLVLIAVIAFGLKAGFILDKISLGEDGIFKNFVKTLPGVEPKLQGENDGRINVLLLGMRGKNVPGGGLLADTIMVLSIHPKDEKKDGDTSRASLVSIPRDLYVKVPNRNEERKINAVYALGEERGAGKGVADMQQIVGEITGQSIPYAAVINFEGFRELIDALGGIKLSLAEPFQESVQFLGIEHRCDGITYTIPSGNYEEKRIQRKNGKYYANPKRYPLCFAKIKPETLECGGNFKLPAGDNQLSGERALCYARSRATSNDFERARRQQLVIQAIKDKALTVGTLTDFGKINGLLDSLGDNILVKAEAWEMKRLFALYQKSQDATLKQFVLENSEEGLLYSPAVTNGAGYILLPRGDNYDRIRALFQTLP